MGVEDAFSSPVMFDPADVMAQEDSSWLIHSNSHQIQNVTSANYLGVKISSELRLDSHIAEVTSRANRTLGFVRRNLRICSHEAKGAPYKSLMRPSWSTIVLYWTVSCIDSTEKVRRHAVRWAMQDYKLTSSVTVTLEEPFLQSRRKRARLSTLCKFRQKIGSDQLLLLWYALPQDLVSATDLPPPPPTRHP